MIRLCTAVALVGMALASLPASAAGDPEAGKAKSTVCAACHGADGNSANPEWPSLAGQHEGYAIDQLMAFRGGDRVNVLMSAQAAGLSDEDMADLAAYYRAQTITPTPADPELAARGGQLYRLGDAERGIAACVACHGPKGLGNGPAGMPVIAGQKSVYLISQLKAYASGDRVADSETKTRMMQLISERLSDEDMAALAAFVGALQ